MTPAGSAVGRSRYFTLALAARSFFCRKGGKTRKPCGRFSGQWTLTKHSKPLSPAHQAPQSECSFYSAFLHMNGDLAGSCLRIHYHVERAKLPWLLEWNAENWSLWLLSCWLQHSASPCSHSKNWRESFLAKQCREALSHTGLTDSINLSCVERSYTSEHLIFPCFAQKKIIRSYKDSVNYVPPSVFRHRFQHEYDFLRRISVHPHNPSQEIFPVDQGGLDLLAKVLTLKNSTNPVSKPRLTYLVPPKYVEAVIFSVEGDAIGRRTEKKEKRLFRNRDRGTELV